MSYTGQAIITRKFGNLLSLAVLPTYIHRNRVAFMDVNDMFAVGIGGRLRFSNRVALVVDYFLPFREQASKDYFAGRGIKFYNPLGVGVEIETGGHVFHLTSPIQRPYWKTSSSLKQRLPGWMGSSDGASIFRGVFR